jgi:hypothetical protein
MPGYYQSSRCAGLDGGHAGGVPAGWLVIFISSLSRPRGRPLPRRSLYAAGGGCAPTPSSGVESVNFCVRAEREKVRYKESSNWQLALGSTWQLAKVKATAKPRLGSIGMFELSPLNLGIRTMGKGEVSKHYLAIGNWPNRPNQMQRQNHENWDRVG